MPLYPESTILFCIQFMLTLIWLPVCCVQEELWLKHLDDLASYIDCIFGISHYYQTFILALITIVGVLICNVWNLGDFPALTIIKTGFFCAGLIYMCQQGLALKQVQSLHPWRAPVDPSNLMNAVVSRYSIAHLLALIRRIGLTAFATGFSLNAIELVLHPSTKVLFDLVLNLSAWGTMSWIVIHYVPKSFPSLFRIPRSSSAS